MAHKVLDGGTAYEITGGKVLDSGTAYDVTGGKCLVDGAVMEISFYREITVNITGTGAAAYCYAMVAGTKYTAPGSVTVPPGTEITAFAWSSSNVQAYSSTVTLNGTKVANGTFQGAAASYTFTPDCHVVNIELKFSGESNRNHVYITTE